jgi:head-tail adaptor
VTVRSMIETNGVTVTIATKSADTVDATGGRIESWSSVSSVTGALQVKSGSDGVQSGSERRQRSATLYLLPDVSITFKDRVTYSGATFEVTSVRTPDERSLSDALAYQIVELIEVFG